MPESFPTLSDKTSRTTFRATFCHQSVCHHILLFFQPTSFTIGTDWTSTQTVANEPRWLPPSIRLSVDPFQWFDLSLYGNVDDAAGCEVAPFCMFIGGT